MTSLKDFHEQRAKVIVPKTASLRPYRRLHRPPEWRNLERAFRGIFPTTVRIPIALRAAKQNSRHANIMDPFRFPEPRPGRNAKMRKRAAAERIGRYFQVQEVMSILRVVQRARGQIDYAPQLDWSELPVVGR